MKPVKVLVTGGCGFIGGHVTRQLSARGFQVTVIDDLSTGSAESLLHGERLVVGDIGDEALLAKVFSETAFDAVLHFAASISVSESVDEPLHYYDRNVTRTLKLLSAVQKHGISAFIFSSTAAVYGINDAGIVDETAPINPQSPYARTKLACEWALCDLSAISSTRHVILRYFNVAGAQPDGLLGQRTKGATHLIKVACETALGLLPRVQVFGTDYPTPDGTGVRDYIHVEDLATAHVNALEYLLAGGESQILNCGYGRGASVREVISMVKACVGHEFEVVESPRRKGDIPKMVANAAKLRKVLGWSPRYDDLKIIISSTIAWEKHMRTSAEKNSIPAHPGAL